MNQPDIRPNRQNWRQFCQELELTTDDEATWREMAAAINETDGNALSDYIAAATATEEAEYLRTHYRRYGLPPDCLGDEFKRAGVTYRITGANPKCRRYPITAERISDGKGFKFPAEDVQNGMAWLHKCHELTADQATA